YEMNALARLLECLEEGISRLGIELGEGEIDIWKDQKRSFCLERRKLRDGQYLASNGFNRQIAVTFLPRTKEANVRMIPCDDPVRYGFLSLGNDLGGKGERRGFLADPARPLEKVSRG